MDSDTILSRERICKNCSVVFTFAIGPGKARLHCSDACRVQYQTMRRPPRSEWPKCSSVECGNVVRSHSSKLCAGCYRVDRQSSSGTCTVRKCTMPATRKGGTLCEKHYYRARRGVDVENSRHVFGRHVSSSGYVKVLRRGHPLADSRGYAYEHRVVLYEAMGGVSPNCFWCGKTLAWKQVSVDHLNEAKSDNRPENLVPACHICNRVRGAIVPFLRGMRCEAVSPFIETIRAIRAASAMTG